MHTPRLLHLAFLSLSVAAGFAGHTAQAQSALAALHPLAQANRVAAHPRLGPTAQLAGHIPGWVNDGNQVFSRAVDLSAPLHVSIVLRRDPAVQAAFTQFLADQQNPSSPFYHQWLTPQQVGALFGPTASDVEAVKSWVASQGLSVDSISPSRVILEVSGSTRTLANAFRTSFGYFNLDGVSRLSAISEPFVPEALAPVIDSLHGLTDIPLRPMSIVSKPHQRPATPSTGPLPDYTLGTGENFLTPNDYTVIYDIKSVYTGGNTGATIGSKSGHVAIIGRALVAATDISEYATNVALSTYNLNTIFASTVSPEPLCTFDDASTCSSGGDQGESTLDIDRVIGTAPGVQADFVTSGTSAGYDGIYVSAAYNVNTLVDPVMTISYGACEAEAGSSGVNLWDTLFSTGAAEGITTFVSSDDSGANGCAPSFNSSTTAYTASINYICSSSYDTCVGGTEFNDTANYATYWSSTNGTGLESAKSYIPEGGWNESNGGANDYTVTASGGGASSYILKPSWQTGTGVPADGARDVPDVSYPAAGHTGVFTCLDFELGLYTNQGIGPSDNCTAAGGGYFFGFEGTSAAAPTMAGVAGLLNTQLGAAQGNLNPLLYKLAATASASGVFHDITTATSGVADCVITTPSMCNNSTPGAAANSVAAPGGVEGYPLNTGYDEVTGLGSIDVGNFLAAATLIAPGVTLTTPTALSFISGATTGNTTTSTLTSVNGFAGAVTLSCSISAGPEAFPPTCTVSPLSPTLSSGGTQSETITISSTAAQGKTSGPQQAGFAALNFKGGLLAAALLCLLPLRRRRVFRSLAAITVLALGLAGLSGCGGSNNGVHTGSGTKSSAGSYTVTVTATGTAVSTSTSFGLTIN